MSEKNGNRPVITSAAVTRTYCYDYACSDPTNQNDLTGLDSRAAFHNSCRNFGEFWADCERQLSGYDDCPAGSYREQRAAGPLGCADGPPSPSNGIFTVQVCPLICVSVATQGGMTSFSFGQVGLGGSANLGYSRTSICNSDDVSVGGSVIVGAGGYYSRGLKGQKFTKNQEAGAGVGFGFAVTAGANKTVRCG